MGYSERLSETLAPHELRDNSSPAKLPNLLNLAILKTMAPKSLLRYIFRHGPNSKSRDAVPPPQVAHVAPYSTKTAATSKETVRYDQNVRTTEIPDSPLAYKHQQHPSDRPNSRASSVLEDIAEETNTSPSPSLHSTVSIASTLRSIDVQTFSTRELILATLNEAKSANLGHLDTIDTSLALLGALEGFSATVGVLRDEMLDKKEIYEEKMGLLEHLERAVECMRFGEEDGQKR
ncbi:hypothetical protein HBI56_112110 [Parastagonospora nodorum]|nr:hypothetical protein HBI10_051480 [Parastagonospora nodorum]KAH4018345.1 hypothetical protein HBI13_131640 [Parastagonospora nodorum]KAH4207627.1 hypothetical protein HBI95_106460 [Parastagonospora nodorum]KAH5023449.1 hypothetical protein HBI74_137380 [Parastagonospora nodorum]KAH5099649.1 hypothetical protein HBH72_106220 [Parastagonospora nodorum]